MIDRATHRQEPSEAAAELLSRRAELAHQLLELSEYLPVEDQALMRGVYDRGMKPVDFARAVRAQPRSLRYRLRQLVERVSSPLYKFVISNHRNWPQERRLVAEMSILRGSSQREISRTLGVTLHRVRQELLRIRAQCDRERGS